jgi:hypothetical protein
MDARASELVIQWYIDLEERLLNFIKHIPYTDKNRKVALPLLAGIVVEAGSLIDTIFREEYGGSSKNRDQLNISDFAEYYEKEFSFSNKKSILYVFPPSYLNPFMSWTDSSSGKYEHIEWWKSYNRLKHSRIQHSELSTLETALNAMCGFHQVISQLPVFANSLLRHDMVSYGGWAIESVADILKDRNSKYTLLIESELFAIPKGPTLFPDKISDIQPLKYGQGKKLSRFMGREI